MDSIKILSKIYYTNGRMNWMLSGGKTILSISESVYNRISISIFD